ncbi:MAG: DegV family protein [Oscillospiraceae bacterium]
MAKIKIMTDSASDISYELEKENDILIVPFKIAIGGQSYVSRVDFDNEKFYRLMDENDEIPLTSQITVTEYMDIFEKLYSEGYTDVINVTINANGSATYNNSVMAAQQFIEEHPDAQGKFRVYTINGNSYSGAYGYAVIQAAQKAKKGTPAEEIVNYVTDWVNNARIYFAPYSLRYAKKSGRIPSAAAFAGELMGLRPIMKISSGVITTAGKVRGDKAINPKIIDFTLKDMIPQTPYSVIYGSDKSVGDELAAAMTKKLGYPPAEYFQIGAAIAANAGPKVSGLIFKAQNG